MWNKQIVVTNHAQKRFSERNIKFSKKNKDIVKQILLDLKPLNIKTMTRIRGEEEKTYKVLTRQGKIYIVVENSRACFVKTVYKNKYAYDKFNLITNNYKKNIKI